MCYITEPGYHNYANYLAGPIVDEEEVAFVIDDQQKNKNGGEMKTTENLIFAPTTTTTTAPRTTPTSAATPARVTGPTELSGQVCFKNGAYLPDLGDCSVVYQCVGGSLIKLFCRNGLFWNHMKQGELVID